MSLSDATPSVRILVTQVDGTKQTFPARPQQFTLGVGAQIPGFDEAVLDMKVGETRTVIVPPKLGCASTASSILLRHLHAIDATSPSQMARTAPRASTTKSPRTRR